MKLANKYLFLKIGQNDFNFKNFFLMIEIKVNKLWIFLFFLIKAEISQCSDHLALIFGGIVKITKVIYIIISIKVLKYNLE